MNSRRIAFGLVVAAVLTLGCLLPRGVAFAQGTPASHEYLTIRWGGKEHTHIIRPGGQVEFIGAELRKFTRPDRCDDRAFYLNIAMNGLVKEGWEFAGMNPDEIVMRRGLGR